MKKTEYSKIFWGIATMFFLFIAILAVPKGIKLLVKALNVHAQSSSFFLANMDPSRGPAGTVVSLYGSGFSSTNTVNFGTIPISGVPSSDGKNLQFNVPTTVPNSSDPLPSGDYAVSVSNSSGTSNAYLFTVYSNCDNSDCNASSTYSGPVYLCTGSADCIQGFKVPIGGIADSQTVTLDGNFTATTTSYSFDGLSPGLHTVSVTVPTDWYSGFTLCINSIDCHADIPIQGHSVSINFLTTNVRPYLDSNGLVSVPAGSYVDLYWHFSQNFNDFAAAPPGLGSQTGGTSTASTTRSNQGQVDSYTGGTVSTTGDADAASGLAQAATNALGCTIGQILTPAIRGVIASDQSLLAPPPARGGGGSAGGGSIDINDTTAPYITRNLPAINGSTYQNANDVRYARAANVGFPNQPSWDAVSYCLENAMLKYIQQSTLTWMYTAFNGNPAFVQNLSQFMLGIENQTAKNFFNKLGSTYSSAPFGSQLLQGTVASYNAQSSLGSYNASAVNKPGLDGWFAISQYDSNNVIGAQKKTSDQLAAAIHSKRESEQLKFVANNGTLNVDDCSGTEKPDAFGNPTNCKASNTGYLINQSFGANAYLANQRLANNSGSFDQTVNQLVNQLIQSVLGQLFKKIGGH